MVDREKVIKGLEYHMQELGVGKTCFGCSYFGDNPCEILLIEDVLELLEDDETQLIYRDEIIKAHEDEIERLNELLKEQEPVEPKVEPAIVPTFKAYSCGHCDAVFHLWRQKYCTNCGRKVKWDG